MGMVMFDSLTASGHIAFAAQDLNLIVNGEGSIKGNDIDLLDPSVSSRAGHPRDLAKASADLGSFWLPNRP